METQKIVNLLNDPNNEFSKFATREMGNMAEEMKMIRLLNFRQKLLNQIFVITQMHMFLWQQI